MKKLVVTALAIVACVSAFGQGKVIFGNDSNHLITLTPTTAQLPAAWNSLAGLAVPQMGGANPQNINLLTVELWGGTSAANLALQRTSSAAGLAGLPDGRINNVNTILTGVAAGVGTFQFRVYETAAGSYANASTGVGGAWLFGESPTFTSTSGSLLYNPLTLPGAPSNSNWANGPIVLAAIPEPSTFALAGLGAAAMLIFRRRK